MANSDFEDKSYKICSVLGGLDVTRVVSSNTRRFFEGAIEDVELIREFVSEATFNGGIMGGITKLDRLSRTLDWKARGFEKETTTIEAGLGYVDDRAGRRMERYVSIKDEPLVGDKETDLAIANTVSLIFPWVVDRKSNENMWWIDHQNGRSEGNTKVPFLFESLYIAAWLGTYGEAWAYYPPFTVWGHPFNFGEVLDEDYQSHEEPFVKPNLPENNPLREAFFTTPYPDTAQPGLSLITAMAPVYYTGEFQNHTYNDTYLASTGLDIAVSSVSSLLDVLHDKLTKLSFGLLVDANFNIIVVSQAVVEMIYPERTGFEDTRVVIDKTDGSVVEDRRNETYLVSDTIHEPLTNLQNANWTRLLQEVNALVPGERAFSKLNLTLTGDEYHTEFYVMYERWKYVANWVLMAFAPTHEVTNAIKIAIFGRDYTKNNTSVQSSIFLSGEKGHVLDGDVFLVNKGTLDVQVSTKKIPKWVKLSHAIDKELLLAGDTLPLHFNVSTEQLDFGVSSELLTFNIQDDHYPDCFYDNDVSLTLSVKVTPQDCVVSTGDVLRVADSEGNCVCVANAVEIGGTCVAYSVLLPAILVPLVIIGLIGVYIYVERKRKQGDSVWAVKSSELKFREPPEIAGRGTFGLVLLAEYRGTQVAVKRVIPPKIQSKVKGGKMERRRSNFGTGAMDSTLIVEDPMASTMTKKLSTRFDFENAQVMNDQENGSLKNEKPNHMDDSPNRSFKGSAKSTEEQNTIPKEEKDEIPKVKVRDLQICSDMQSNIMMPSIETTGSGTFMDSMALSSIMASGSLATQDKPKRSSFGCNINVLSHKSQYARLKSDFIHEMRHLSKLRHPCITTVMGAVISKWEEPLLVMEYMEHGSLYDLLHNDTMVVYGDLILPILKDVTQGVRFLHAADPQVIHGDLKAQNILVDSKFRAKVADFGLSQKKQVGATGTPYWMAPELLRGESTNTVASDVYSFGIILYEVYSREDPYKNEDFRRVLHDICDPEINKRPIKPESMPAQVGVLMSDCLGADPNKRPSYEEIDNRLKRFSIDSVEPGKLIFSKQEKKIQHELNPELLLEVFPAHIAKALSDGCKVEPEHHECVTIFFSDIVGFTVISGKLPPIKVSDMLDRLYLKFDSLSHKHDIFKMETIGDAWMGVSNIHKKQTSDHTKRIAEFSRDAIKAANETLIDTEDPDMGYVQIRVGFHAGPVLSNVVGSRNPKYAIFGDTVNTSSRMESNSQPGRIHASNTAAELLREQAPEIPMLFRGEINIKGKGEMKTYWVFEQEMEQAIYQALH